MNAMLPLPTQQKGGFADARLRNDLRAAKLDYQSFAVFDDWPRGNPWAEQRDAALDRIRALKAILAPSLTKESGR